MTFGRFFLVLLMLLAGFVLAVRQELIDIPPRWNPWAPLDIREPPNLLTSLKLRRLQQDRSLCEQALATAPLRYTAVPDSTPEPGCPVENSVRVQGSDVRFNGPFLATCPLAAAYAMFEMHGLQPAAQAVFGQPVVRIDHFGSFACRNIARSNVAASTPVPMRLTWPAFICRTARVSRWPGTGRARATRRVSCVRCAMRPARPST